ncbi:MAG: hypothetical protein JWP14_3381 [Frankiales bacterium]|nr:hypothetical protein [Frankiales bacterium]
MSYSPGGTSAEIRVPDYEFDDGGTARLMLWRVFWDGGDIIVPTNPLGALPAGDVQIQVEGGEVTTVDEWTTGPVLTEAHRTAGVWTVASAATADPGTFTVAMHVDGTEHVDVCPTLPDGMRFAPPVQREVFVGLHLAWGSPGDEASPGFSHDVALRPDPDATGYTGCLRIKMNALSSAHLSWFQYLGNPAHLTFAQLEFRSVDDSEYLCVEQDSAASDGTVLWDGGVVGSRGTDLAFDSGTGNVTSTAGGLFDVTLCANFRRL